MSSAAGQGYSFAFPLEQAFIRRYLIINVLQPSRTENSLSHFFSCKLKGNGQLLTSALYAEFAELLSY